MGGEGVTSDPAGVAFDVFTHETRVFLVECTLCTLNGPAWKITHCHSSRVDCRLLHRIHTYDKKRGMMIQPTSVDVASAFLREEVYVH